MYLLFKNSVDSIGAGDVFFSWSSLFYFINKNLSLSAFCGSIAASYNVFKLGNKVIINRISFLRSLFSILK